MKRKSYGRDAGLSLRMLLTSAMLGLLYVLFAVVLFQVLNVGLAPMLVIVIGLAAVQYWTSDKLALAASGAKIVSREEAPELHAMVERLCAMADLPKPRVAMIPTDMPNAFAGRSEPPSEAEVALVLGKSQSLWQELVSALKRDLGLGEQWGSSSIKAGWSLRLQSKKRNIVYLSPGVRVSIDKWSGYVSLGIPVINEPNGIQPEPSLRIITGLSLAF